MRRVLPRVVVDARAKLNLMLAVGPRRADGYHDLVTVFQSVSLADTLIFEPQARGFSLRVRFEDVAAKGRPLSPAIPRGPDNLVLRAARRVAAELSLDHGARITLIKRIPVAAGLGGGSADAAATIAALPRLHRRRLSLERQLAIAAELGADVPFARIGGTMLGLGRGETLVPVRLEKPFRAVIAHPAWGISTAHAYAEVDRRRLALTAKGAKLRSAEILGRKRLSETSLVRLGNTFERVLGERRSDFVSLRRRLGEAGALAARLTGSGSAVFGVLGSGSPAVGVVGRFTGSERLYVVRSTRRGLRLRH